jgi:hypothetical protein
VYSGNKTTILSKIHQCDYAHAVVHARRLIAPNGTCNTTEKRTSPRAQTPPSPTQSSPASPELGLGSPANPAMGHSFKLWQASSNLRMGSITTSDGPLLRLSLVLTSIFVTEDNPDDIGYSETDTSLKKFFPLLALCQPLRYGQPLQRED